MSADFEIYLFEGTWKNPRLHLSGVDGTSAKLTALAGGERRRGAYLSKLVARIYEARGSETVTLERLQAQIDGMLAQSKQSKARLADLERQVAALMAERV